MDLKKEKRETGRLFTYQMHENKKGGLQIKEEEVILIVKKKNDEPHVSSVAKWGKSRGGLR